MNEKEKSRIIVLWESGHNAVTISRVLSIPFYKVSKFISEIKRDEKLAVNRKTTVQYVCELYDEGYRNALAISKKAGVSLQTVYCYLSQNNRHFGRKSKNYSISKKTKLILKDLDEGVLSQSEIARKHNVSRQYISELLKKRKEKNNE